MDCLTLQDKDTTILCNAKTLSPKDTVLRPQNTAVCRNKEEMKLCMPHTAMTWINISHALTARRSE